MQNIIPWLSVAQQIVSILGIISIIFLVINFVVNKNVRNIQLMQRCIDIYKNWLKEKPLNYSNYLEFLGEELFYFQKNLIEKKVAIEWIEGILDNIAIYGKETLRGEEVSSHKIILNSYADQKDLEELPEWKRKDYFARIDFFIRPNLKENIFIPAFNDADHRSQKQKLAKSLYKHIRNYKY